jgi:hypothetical protein
MAFGSIASFALYSRTTKPQITVASLIFLMARAFSVHPVPRDPAEISPLNEPDTDVDEDKVTVAHGAEIKKSVPVHCGISNEASIASKASSCSAN